MTTTTLSPVPLFHGFANDGTPLSFGKLFSYQAGSSTKQATYTDASGGQPNTNPVILNARGECNLWVPPNTPYKFVLAYPTDTDPPTNPIWTVDNIVNSQLITLWAGVDTGSANAYVLNFVANFTAYNAGIVLYWLPSHTNTGPSTLNVNNLGVVALVNPDGSALQAGEVVANQIAVVVFNNNQWQLITPATIASGQFAGVWTGFSGSGPGNVNYRRTGNQVSLVFSTVRDTSNSTQFVLTNLPPIATPSILFQVVPIAGVVDNGALVSSFSCAVILAGGAVVLYKSVGSLAGTGDWTATGSKGFTSAGLVTITYTV